MAVNKSRKETRKWMYISGATGAAFFLLANVIHVFHGRSLQAAYAQLCINTFVFVAFRRGRENETSFIGKVIAHGGTFVPILMASITIRNVILPAYFPGIHPLFPPLLH